MTYDYKKGDVLIDSEGDLMEYLGDGYYKWITFEGVPDPSSKPQELSKLSKMITHRKLTKLEKVMK